MTAPLSVALDGTALGSGRGGDETYLRGLLRGLREVASPDDRFPLFLRPGASAVDLVDDRFPSIALPGGSAARRLTVSMRRSVQRVSPRPDLLHSITHAPVASPVPSALTVTDLSFRHHPEHYRPDVRLRLESLVPRQARRASAVITLSEFCRTDLVENLGLDEEKVFVVPCAVEPIPELGEDTWAEAATWCAERGVRGPFIAYVGNLHPRKNVARLITAFSAAVADGRLDGCQLVIAGARWWGGGHEERAAAAAPDGSVVLLGRVSEAVRVYVLRAAAAVAYPSVFEGFGLPPIEAMSAGTPVLTSRCTSLPEVVGDAALLVDPLDEDEIADGLVRLVTDDHLRASLRTKGVARAQQYDAARTGTAALAAFRAARARGAPVGASSVRR